MKLLLFVSCFYLIIFSNLFAVISSLENTQLFPLSIIHINDFHARFEESSQSGGICNPNEKCIGGYARLVHIVKQLLEIRKNTNPIYLNAGDSFQGTLWYNIGRWNVTSHFLNLLPADAMTLGNHEFDHGISGVVPFLETINSPMVVVNIDDSQEPDIQGKYKKSIVIERSGRKIGIIGVILQTTDEIANTGKLKFLSETKTIAAEAEKLKMANVNIIIVLSHCGLDVDRIIAKNAGPNIDVIVGGHSHTFLYNSDKNLPGTDIPADTYPVEIIQENGRKVLIVQALAFAKYVGDLTVFFDDNGEVVNYEGSPIYLDSNIPQDPEILRELKPWKDIVDAEGKREIGISRVSLSKSRCTYDECNIGSFLTDSYIYAYAIQTQTPENEQESWTSAAIALTNVGGIRSSLDIGVLTYSHLVTTIPFENTVDSFDLLGEHLLDALEFSVSKSWNSDKFSGAYMLQVSGLKIIYDIKKPIGQRVIDVKVLCQKCLIPEYFPLNKNETYRIIAASFLANGGDGFKMFKQFRQNYQIGAIDIDIFEKYVLQQSPIIKGTEKRIILYQ